MGTNPKKVGKIAFALLLGAIAGYVFYITHMPLPWMLGAMFANAIASISGAPVASPGKLRPIMLGVLGTMLGATFGVNFLTQLLLWKTTLAGMLVCTLIGAFASYVLMVRFGRMSRATAYYAAMPGGLSEMALLAEQSHADTPTVALVHACRIFLTVSCLPFLIEILVADPIVRPVLSATAFDLPTIETLIWLVGITLVGSLAGRVLRLPAGFLLGPLSISAVVHIGGFADLVVPPILVAAAQVVLGTNVGTRFAGFDRQQVLRLSVISVLTTVILLTTAILAGLLFSFPTGESPIKLLLAYAPGGVAEMSMIALALHWEVAFVTVHHLLRLIFVIVLARWTLRWFTQQN